MKGNGTERDAIPYLVLAYYLSHTGYVCLLCKINARCGVSYGGVTV